MNRDSQVFYMDRWVDKKDFRVFVYNKAGQKLANTHDEFVKLISSGLWFESIDAVLKNELSNEEEKKQDLEKTTEDLERKIEPVVADKQSKPIVLNEFKSGKTKGS
jgi:hypothetical protein